MLITCNKAALNPNPNFGVGIVRFENYMFNPI